MMRCPWYRWKLSNAVDEAGPLPARLQRHVDRCEGCRRFYRTAQRLAEQLPHPAGPWHDEPSLRDKVLAIVAATHERPAAGRVPAARSRWQGPVMAAAAALLMVLGVTAAILVFVGRPTDSMGTSPTAALQGIIQQAVPAGRAGGRDPAIFQAWVTRPYARELECLGRQAESSVRFVASCIGVEFEPRLLPPGPDAALGVDVEPQVP